MELAFLLVQVFGVIVQIIIALWAAAIYTQMRNIYLELDSVREALLRVGNGVEEAIKKSRGMVVLGGGWHGENSVLEDSSNGGAEGTGLSK